jgi:hypothetical protein
MDFRRQRAGCVQPRGLSVDKQRRNNQHGAGNNQLSGGRAPEPGLSYLRQRR